MTFDVGPALAHILEEVVVIWTVLIIGRAIAWVSKWHAS